MNGDAHFSEVFLSDAFVPDDDRIGAVGGGWAVTTALLAHERAGADRSAPTAQATSWPVWLAELANRGQLREPCCVNERCVCTATTKVIRFTQLRAAAAARSGRRPGPEGSGLKLHGSRSFKERVALMAAASGAAALLEGWDACGRLPHLDVHDRPRGQSHPPVEERGGSAGGRHESHSLLE